MREERECNFTLFLQKKKVFLLNGCGGGPEDTTLMIPSMGDIMWKICSRWKAKVLVLSFRRRKLTQNGGQNFPIKWTPPDQLRIVAFLDVIRTEKMILFGGDLKF